MALPPEEVVVLLEGGVAVSVTLDVEDVAGTDVLGRPIGRKGVSQNCDSE